MSSSALTATSSATTPTCFTKANKDPQWRLAMTNEYNAFIQNKTWSLIPRTPSHNLVGCKWVFKLKHKVDRSIDRHKAHLVAKGFHQQQGIDYEETFSLMEKPISIRVILSLAIS
ncbi:uncharacterized mitochondrial protein AtMg00820-like [Impatiens glandulifera]|uniref:uncharacterized mitochondrial protein AtMg00820-like n=1 Tax=Impatiens glandulifera TaxID=253017 RepID=UPI001FB185C9|nr:uncharacterized mitochondrial protein AtMg00820-like [Impatiens glandulifera]